MVQFDRQDPLDRLDLRGLRLPNLAAARFAELALELHNSPTVEQTVDAVIQFALQALHCSYAGIALAGRGHRAEIGAVTDPVVAELYQLQLDTDAGPMLHALTESATVSVPDVASDDRWPAWAERARGLGIGSVLEVPMVGGTQTIGVLSLFHTATHAFSTDDEAIAHILARHATVAVATARQEQTLAQAVDARKLIGQAMGILMERFDLDADRAFALLRRYSQTHNIKLRDVAQHLIDTRKLPTK